MSRDDDRRERSIEDYWYYRNRDWDRKDDAKKRGRELERLRLKPVGGRRRLDDDQDDQPAENAPEVTYEALLEEKAKLLKQIAATFEAGEQDELYGLLNDIRLYDSATETQFDHLLKKLEKCAPAPTDDKRPLGRSSWVENEGFNILQILREQAQKEEQRKIEHLRVGIAFLRSEWRLYHSSFRR